jgi:hypothetical protein
MPDPLSPFAVPGVLPFRPLECEMETSLRDWLDAEFAQPGYFLLGARVLAGHSDRRAILHPEELAADPDAAAANAKKPQVVIFGDNHRETFEDADGTDRVTLTIDVMTHLRLCPDAQVTHDRIVGCLRAIMSRAWMPEARAGMNASTTSMFWQGWNRGPEDGASTIYAGDVVISRTTYEASGYIIPTAAES